MNDLVFAPFPTVTTERLLLRQPQEKDAQEIFLLRSDEAVNKYLDRQSATSVEDALQFIQKINSFIEKKQSFYWVITLKDEMKVIGAITLFNFSEGNSCAEIGYELRPHYQRKGFMQEAMQAAISFAFKNAGFKKLEAFTHPENNSSYKLLEKNNFCRDEKAEQQYAAKGGLKNMIIYALINPDR